MTANREGLVVLHSKQMCIGRGGWDSEHFVLETYVGWLDGWGTSLEIEEEVEAKALLGPPWHLPQ